MLMAVYKQEFFVPYLQNLCGLYMAERQLTRYLNDRRSHIPQEAFDTLNLSRSLAGWMIHRAHQIDILPDSCRNIRCVYFLNTWFSGICSDDLDHALRLYSVMVDPAELDQDIARQEQEILTRLYQTALAQHPGYEPRMKEKLKKMYLSREEHDLYTKMIEITAAAMDYFAAAEAL